jgi:hypothetical protein
MSPYLPGMFEGFERKDSFQLCIAEVPPPRYVLFVMPDRVGAVARD